VLLALVINSDYNDWKTKSVVTGHLSEIYCYIHTYMLNIFFVFVFVFFISREITRYLVDLISYVYTFGVKCVFNSIKIKTRSEDIVYLIFNKDLVVTFLGSKLVYISDKF